MRVLGILFLFLNLIGSSLLWSSQSPSSFDFTIHHSSDPTSELYFQQSTTLRLGEALPFGFVPERPVVRATNFFFYSHFIINTISGLSAICEKQGINYQRLALGDDINLPTFLIVFPHHNFT